MAMYRKKPVIIEARQFISPLSRDWSTVTELAKWCGGDFFPGSPIGYIGDGYPHIAISTLEGVMRAQAGDWIIRGVQGEFYPCKPDIFDATYQLVSP